jgi:mannose-1-phosphate guanylyltransferase/mannose-6-phosphate isomerase
MIPVVLSGGMGTRLWPLSRSAFPKQFCELLDESLLEKTLKRLAPLGSPWTLTVKELESLTSRVFRSLQIPLAQILYEPMGRNTAPALALLCQYLNLQSRDHEIVGIFPADHLVLKEEEFHKAVRLAQVCAEGGWVATLGIRPQHPATGFGYIETSNEKIKSVGDLDAFATLGFREKPDLATAESFLAKGNFFWNAGIFVFKVETMSKHFAKFLPELWREVQKLRPDLSNVAEVYAKLPSVSIDYGIMEKLKEQVCIPCDIGWSDLGSWDDVAEFGSTPSSVVFTNRADVVQTESTNNFVFSISKKVYGLVDVDDLIIVDTDDATLIARKGSSQDVRKIVDILNQKQHVAAREHRFELRPWGGFAVLRDEPHYKSKLITVEPGSQISYQSHNQRSEHWVVVRGQGEVVLDSVTIPIKAGESVNIPKGAKHRIRNNGSERLEFIEVQTGTYFGEDDIIRYEDDYSRA